jgi:hypothetical protein
MKTKIYVDEDDISQEEQSVDIIEKLGEGNQAIVFLVEIDQRKYALKLVRV